jgi:2-furoyl-CoA dehydrogenase FAD binding subunit
VKPPAFDYVRVDTADEAVDLLGEYGEEARVLAGGQSLMPILNMRLAQPSMLIDISRCAELSSIHCDEALKLGAAVTQGALERHPMLASKSPLLAQALPHISHFQVRSRGTVCGSLAHAEPSAELPLVLAARGREHPGLEFAGGEVAALLA